MKAALGSLEKVKRIVRIEGVLNVAPGFTEMPAVLNGASHLVNGCSRSAARHTRMLYTNPEMPLDCACLIIRLGGSRRVTSAGAKEAGGAWPPASRDVVRSAADELPVPGAEAVAVAAIGLVVRPVVGARGE